MYERDICHESRKLGSYDIHQVTRIISYPRLVGNVLFQIFLLDLDTRCGDNINCNILKQIVPNPALIGNKSMISISIQTPTHFDLKQWRLVAELSETKERHCCLARHLYYRDSINNPPR